MRWGRTAWIVPAALACAVALVLPAAAAENEGSLEDAIVSFTLQGSNGYSMLVLAGSDFDDPPRPDGRVPGDAIVYLLHRPNTAVYFGPTTVTGGFIEGTPTITSVRTNLGALGRLAIDFKPAGGKTTATNRRCGGDGFVYAAGSYEGTIEFHGEQGFTDLSATTAAQRPEAILNLICGSRGVDERSGPRLPGAKLEVERLEPRAESIGLPRLQVNKNDPRAKVHVEAATAEEKGPIGILRTVEMDAPAGAFTFDRRIRHARLKLPAPFSGRGVYRRDAKPRNQWSGDLMVDFPGRSNVRLTGRGLDATLVHAVRRLGPPGNERLARTLQRIAR